MSEHTTPIAVAAPARFASGWHASKLVARREIAACFDSSIAYVFAVVFLLLSSSLFMNSFFLNGLVHMGEYFANLPYLLVLFAPAITMRSWAEERAQGTFELLLTLPLPMTGLIVGKFVASLVFYLLVLSGSLPIVFVLMWLGEPDLGVIFSSYLGAALLGGLFLAFGLFVSGLTKDQIVAFAATTFGLALFVLSGEQQVIEVLDGLAPSWQPGSWLHQTVSVAPHYEAFCRGWIAVSDVAYFVVLTIAFLCMNRLTLRFRGA